MNHLVQSKNKKVILFAGVFVFLSFNCFLNIHYSIDSFNILTSANQDVSNHIQNGRIFYWLVVSLLNFLDISLVLNNILWVFVFMCVLVFSISILTIKATKYFSNDSSAVILVFLAVSVSFVHGFIAEWFQFTEALLMYSFSVLGSVLAVIVFPLKQEENNRILKYFLAFVFLTISYNSYQIGINYFIFYILCFILLESENQLSLTGIRNTCVAAFLVLLTFSVNYAIVKILISANLISSWSRITTVSMNNITFNLYTLFLPHTQYDFWLRGNGMLKNPDLLLLLLMSLPAAIFTLISEKKKWYDFLFVFILLVGGVFALILPLLIVDVFWMAPRTVVPFFCIYTFLMLILAKNKRSIPKNIAIVVLALFLLRQVWFIQNYSADVRTSNNYDKMWTEYIDTEIAKYEENNQISVTQIGYLKDDSAAWSWDDISYSWDVCNRSIVVDWAQNHLLSFYTNRNLDVVQIPDHIKSHFQSSTQTESLLDTMVFFEENTCYVYIH